MYLLSANYENCLVWVTRHGHLRLCHHLATRACPPWAALGTACAIAPRPACTCPLRQGQVARARRARPKTQRWTRSIAMRTLHHEKHIWSLRGFKDAFSKLAYRVRCWKRRRRFFPNLHLPDSLPVRRRIHPFLPGPRSSSQPGPVFLPAAARHRCPNAHCKRELNPLAIPVIYTNASSYFCYTPHAGNGRHASCALFGKGPGEAYEHCLGSSGRLRSACDHRGVFGKRGTQI